MLKLLPKPLFPLLQDCADAFHPLTPPISVRLFPRPLPMSQFGPGQCLYPLSFQRNSGYTLPRFVCFISEKHVKKKSFKQAITIETKSKIPPIRKPYIRVGENVLPSTSSQTAGLESIFQRRRHSRGKYPQTKKLKIQPRGIEEFSPRLLPLLKFPHLNLFVCVDPSAPTAFSHPFSSWLLLIIPINSSDERSILFQVPLGRVKQSLLYLLLTLYIFFQRSTDYIVM